MNFQGIALYTLRAAIFAAAACGAYALILKMRGAQLTAGRLISVFYLAALVEITVLRGGADWGKLFQLERPAAQWAPMRTTLGALQSGAWPFLYHVGGNILWFLPLGVMLRRKPVWRSLIAGFLVSVAIECLQWVFMTGMADVDDVILNASGALLGRLMAGILPERPRANRTAEEITGSDDNA